MANSNSSPIQIAVTADLASFSNQLINNLFQMIQEDIRNNQKSSDEIKKKCESCLNQLREEYNNCCIKFLKETRHLINEALQISLTEQRDHARQAWKHALTIHADQYKKVIGLISYKLNKCKERQEELQKERYWYLVEVPSGCAVVFGFMYKSGFYDYCMKSTIATDGSSARIPSDLKWIGGGVAITIGSVLIWTKLNSIKSQRKIYEQYIEEVQSFMIKTFPIDLNDLQEPMTTSRLKEIPDDIFNTLKITDEIWSNNTALESLVRMATESLESLTAKS